jgi:hypothetical protein
MILPDTAVPTVKQDLPQFINDIEAKPVPHSSLRQKIFGGHLKAAMRHTAGADRTFEIKLKIKKMGIEHCFKVGSEDDRRELLTILADPVHAAYQAQIQDAEKRQAAAQQQPASSLQGPAETSPRETTESLPPSAPPLDSFPAATALSGGVEQPAENALALASTDSPLPPSQPAKPQPSPQIPVPPSAANSTAVAGSTETQSAASTTAADTIDKSELCCVCMKKRADTAVIPCGHLCACAQCLDSIQLSASPHCPKCSGPMTSIIRIYEV